MVLHVIEYRIDRPSMRDLAFGSATERAPWPSLVAACAARTMLPASAAHVLAFRLEADGADHADEYFLTSTVALYFKADGAYHVAFYDTQRNDGMDNILIRHARAGCNAHRKRGAWRASMRDLTQMIKDAEQRDRIITPGNRKLPINGTYGRDASTTSILGDKTLAHDVDAWLRREGNTTGYNWLLENRELTGLRVNDRYAEVQRVSVGGSGVADEFHLAADDMCSNDGRVRGVRKIING